MVINRHAAGILIISLSMILIKKIFMHQAPSSEGSPRLNEAYRSVIHSICQTVDVEGLNFMFVCMHRTNKIGNVC